MNNYVGLEKYQVICFMVVGKHQRNFNRNRIVLTMKTRVSIVNRATTSYFRNGVYVLYFSKSCIMVGCEIRETLEED